MKQTLAIFSMLVMLCVIIAASGKSLSAQELQFPKLSPKASVTQTVGLTDITITYHRPGVKARVIWGGLVPYDQVWRTGANNATTISFSTDVTLGDKEVKAGTYGLFTIPGKEEWVFIISKQADIWGAMGYEESQDVVRIKAKPATAPFCERMHFYFTDLTDDSAKIVLHWEKLMVDFTVKIDTKGMLMKNIENAMDRYWRTPYSAANYAFENDMPDKAKAWIDTSVSVAQNYWNMLLKAKIYKQAAKTKAEVAEAISILEKANSLIKDLPAPSQQYATEGPELLQEWKGKK